MSSQEFPDDLHLDLNVEVGTNQGNRAWFGRNVLQGLIDGIDDFVQERQPRWQRLSYRTGGAALIGCSPWVNDDRLLEAIEALPGACIVTSKHPKTAGGEAGMGRLNAINNRTTGMSLCIFSELNDMAPKVDGQPRIVGPYEEIHDEDAALSTFRVVGARKLGRDRPPIPHAKLALLGNICWTDEHPAGFVDDYRWFLPRRLWVSSANFTYGSRTNLEFGYWTEDERLLHTAKTFLVRLIGASEELNSLSGVVDPELARVGFDDAAMVEALVELKRAQEEAADVIGQDMDEG